MNREEAIRRINDHMRVHGLNEPNAIYITEALKMALDTLLGPVPDPITGLVPCGCGGIVYPHYQLGWHREESGVQAFEVSTGCDDCGTCTKPRYGHYVNGIDEDDTESASKRDWNISHGYTAPLPEVEK